MFKLDLETTEEPEIKLLTSIGSSKKEESFRKTPTSVYWLARTFDFWITINCGKFLKRWEYQATLHACWEICVPVKKQQLEMDMKQWADSK